MWGFSSHFEHLLQGGEKDEPSLEGANEEWEGDYPERGKTDDLLPMNLEGVEVDVPQGGCLSKTTSAEPLKTTTSNQEGVSKGKDEVVERLHHTSCKNLSTVPNI